MSVILMLIRVGFALGALGVATLAILALFGFAVPELDLLNHGQIFLFPGTLIGLIVIALVMSGRWRSMALIYAFVGFVASANVMVPEIAGALQSRPEEPAAGSVRLMTHNLFGRNYEMEKVTAAILAEDPDIIVLQEYFGEQAVSLHPRLLESYPYSVRCRGGKRANLGLYSRLPFAQIEDGACPEDAYSLTRTAHILAHFETADGKPFSVITTHMDWPIPIARQHEQFRALSEVLDTIDEPLIVGGDFNSTSWSYLLRDFARRNDLIRQTMNLFTFPLSWHYLRSWRETIPFLPIDHVLTRGLVVHSVKTGEPTASDHLPVVVTFSVP